MRVIFIVFFLFLGFEHAYANDSEPECLLIANSSPPLSIIDGKQITGFSVDLLGELFASVGRNIETCSHAPVPWARGLALLETTPGSIMFSVAKTLDRNEKFKWVGPFFSVDIALIGRMDKQFRIETVEDLKELCIGVIRGGAPEEILKRRGIPAVDIDTLPEIADHIQTLLDGRCDLVAHVFPMLAYELRERQIDPKEFEEVFLLKTVDLYFALNKNTPDEEIYRLQNELDNLIRDSEEKKIGAYRKLLFEYDLN